MKEITEQLRKLMKAKAHEAKISINFPQFCLMDLERSSRTSEKKISPHLPFEKRKKREIQDEPELYARNCRMGKVPRRIPVIEDRVISGQYWYLAARIAADRYLRDGDITCPVAIVAYPAGSRGC